MKSFQMCIKLSGIKSKRVKKKLHAFSVSFLKQLGALFLSNSVYSFPYSVLLDFR